MRLFWDTETTGMPDWRAPSNAEHQPHLVQLAMIQADAPGPGRECQMIIRPDGWVISPEVAKIHGITHERAMDEGIAEADAVDFYVNAVAAVAMRVAHNAAFDDRIMRIAMLRHGHTRDAIEVMEARPCYCTCKVATKVLNLPPTEKMVKAGFNRAKQANLTECIHHFFGEKLDGAHDAMIDARACARVYWHLQGLAGATVPA